MEHEKLTWRENEKEENFGQAVKEVSIAILVVVGLFIIGNVALGLD